MNLRHSHVLVPEQFLDDSDVAPDGAWRWKKKIFGAGKNN